MKNIEKLFKKPSGKVKPLSNSELMEKDFSMFIWRFRMGTLIAVQKLFDEHYWGSDGKT